MLALVAATLTSEAVQEFEALGWRLVSAEGEGELSARAEAAGVRAAAVEALVIEAEPVTDDVLEAFPLLKLIACLRGNPVNVDLEAATRRGLPVVHTPGRNTEAVADFVLGLILSTLRHIAHTHHLIVDGQLTEERDQDVRSRKDVIWRPSDSTRPIPYHVYKGPELRSLTLGLLGFGLIGRRVAEKAVALEMRVLAHDPYVGSDEMAACHVEPVSFSELLSHADVLSLHARGSGTPVIGERELRSLKRGSYLVNTARAALVDYDALMRVLADGHLAGAALDVYPDEPLSARSPLLGLETVTLTPHLAGASLNVAEHQSRILLEGVRALLAGGDGARHAVANPDVLRQMRHD